MVKNEILYWDDIFIEIAMKINQHFQNNPFESAVGILFLFSGAKISSNNWALEPRKNTKVALAL